MMNEDKITYKYSVGSCLFFSLGLGLMIYFIITTLYPPFDKRNIDGSILECLVILVPTIYLIYITIKYTIPAITGKIALEISQTGIIDYAKHFVIEWGDITDLRMFENKGVGTLHFYYNELNGSEKYIRTRLMWVKGDARDIYRIIAANLEDRKPNWHASGA